jgi:hypothetical protein
MLQQRPIPMGVSIGNVAGAPVAYAGTAGMLVHSLANPNLKLILSNNHVLGARGVDLCPNSALPRQTYTLQPGTLDILLQNITNPVVAGVVAGFYPLSTSGNLIDAALSSTDLTISKSEILQIGVPTSALGIALPGMPVTKGGRTTGVTTGVVDSVNATVVVSYGASCPTYLFFGQTMIGPAAFSDAGDSGSAILETSTKKPVGLLFAGSTTMTVANQIYWVYSLLNVFAEGTTPTTAPTSLEQLTLSQRALEAGLDPRIAQVTQVQARNQTHLLAVPGIHAVGVGRDGSDMVLKVYGTKLTDAIARALPQRMEGVRVVFRESGGAFTAR